MKQPAKQPVEMGQLSVQQEETQRCLMNLEKLIIRLENALVPVLVVLPTTPNKPEVCVEQTLTPFASTMRTNNQMFVNQLANLDDIINRISI